MTLAGIAFAVSAEAADVPPEVKVSRPVVRQVTDFDEFNGRTEAALRVDLRARVTGYLDKVSFKEGAEVKQGDVLFEIDPRPYLAEVDRAEARLALSVARLKRAEAEVKRAKALLAVRAITQEEFDKLVADQAEAEAGVAVAKADREAARVNLGFTKVTAPIAGRIGRRFADPGNLVKADETVLAAIVSADPMHVYFDVDERTVLRVRRAVREGKVKSLEVAAIPVAVRLADEEGFPRQGQIDFIDNHLDAEKGTLRARAVLANSDGLLLPGLFVRARLALGAPYKVLLVPERAILTDEGRKFVWVVNDKDAVEYRPVVLGAVVPDGLRVVREGLKEGDRVAVGGLQGLRAGTTVKPVDVPGREKDPE
jgi:RND family efflux transporter MFP subunit